jgi:fructose-bisphosphate aldolase class II
MYMKSTLKFLKGSEADNKWDPPSLFAATQADVIALVVALATEFGSAGKASK